MDNAWWEQHLDEVRRTFHGELAALTPNRFGVRPWGVKDYRNSGGGAISMAIARGAQRIVLLGYDMQYTGGRRHWHGDHPRPLGNAGAIGKWGAHFTQLRADHPDIEIINATRETALTCFPRQLLDVALGRRRRRRKREPVTFVVFLWNSGFREYLPEHVNALARQVARHYPHPHRFVCITDEEGGFEVETMALPDAARAVCDIPTPEGVRFPSCYRRLWLFSDEARVLGPRIMLLDIDCLVVGDLTPLLDYDDDFVGWRPASVWGKSGRIGGGTWLLRAGTHAWVWERFAAAPEQEIRETRRQGWRGSDQAYLSRALHGRCRAWPRNCGIYQRQDGALHWVAPPPDARIVHFNGKEKPWDVSTAWVKKAMATA